MRKRFIKDIDYDILVPPFGLDCYGFDQKQAEGNFNWYIEKIPERIEYLKKRCAQDIGIATEEITLSPESLILIWRWFLNTALIEKTPKKQLCIMRKIFSKQGEDFVSKDKLSVVTEFIVRDIGMFVGEVFVRNYPDIEWSFYTEPENDFFVNCPLLIGFEDDKYSPPYKLVFEPIHMVGVQASKLLDKTQKETDLYDIFMKWTEHIPAK